ncbi:hypothetical protein [Anaerosinus gibii]|uniref:Uncharacterized protein n=1 Tax=Selenobaculum gibii TaxID=3054208 RepID=A0A9Y2AIR4_9FIRM|nr:hypothetical protein [Selenobaculum gbiensis]WIW70612.1 hypothetical protein P3F81_12110 [Selenobaculum gbiensis]
MILDCIEFLKGILRDIGLKKIYDKESDVTAFKGSEYALILTAEKETVDYDGNKVAYSDDFVNGIRTYHIRRYKTALTLTVRLIGKDDVRVVGLKDRFLALLSSSFTNEENYRIAVEAVDLRYIQDKSLLTSGMGYEVDIRFSGGVFVTRQVRLLTGIDTETSILKKGDG